MLPFPIISNTNIVPVASIKKMVIGASNLTILGTDGTLTGYGTNPSGNLGTGSTSTTLGWYDSTLTDVRDVFMNGSDMSIAIKNDGTIWFCGVLRSSTLGSPSLGTSPISTYTNISDRIPVSGNIVIDVKFSYNYVSFLCSDGNIYTTVPAGIMSGTSITSTGYTGWRINTPSTPLVKIFTYADYTGYNDVWMGLDSTGHAYGIGYDGWKQISNTGTGTYTTWTPTISSKTFTDIQFGTNYCIFQSTDNIMYYSGISGIVNVANVNNTTNAYAVFNGSGSSSNNLLYILSGTQIAMHIRKGGSMYGCSANNQMPLDTSNTGNQSLHLLRNVPDIANIDSIKYCKASVKSMFALYDSGAGTRKLWIIGTAFGGTSSNTSFQQVALPAKYT